MTRSGLISCVLASISVLWIMGCGGILQDEHQANLITDSVGDSNTVQAQAYCSARCSGRPNISCSGSSCTGVDFQYVICDGVRTNCPPAPTVCFATFSCESGPTLRCEGTDNRCWQLGAMNSKVCGGVECNGVATYCPPLPGDLRVLLSVDLALYAATLMAGGAHLKGMISLKINLMLLGVAVMLAACGGATLDSPLDAPPHPPQVREPGLVTAMSYPPYDPEVHCLVGSSYVACASGTYMAVYWSSDWGYYIERSVCDTHGGPLVCPY